MNSEIFRRRHPEYAANEEIWKRSRAAYSGGRPYVEQALIRHVSEIDVEYAERRKRAYYFNYPRGIARRITQYALSVDPVREGALPELVEDWSRDGLRTNEVMRQLSTMLSLFGRAWLMVDAPKFSGTLSRQEAAAGNFRPYARALSPLQVPDWAFGPDGKLLWVILREEPWEENSPFLPRRRGKLLRVLERGKWSLFAEEGGEAVELDSGPLPEGDLPIVSMTEPDGFGMRCSHWFEDVVRISEAILNNESESQMNMVKQMFGLLVVSESFARGARRQTQDVPGGFAATIARSAAIIETVEEKGISRFITPSGVPGTLLRQENEALKRELYDLVGLAVTSQSKEAQTAESKAWDFQNAGQFLASRADLLEQTELAGWNFMHRFDPAIPVPQVVYNRKFALRDLEKSIAGLLQLSEIQAGKGYRKALQRSALELVDSINPLPEAEKQEIMQEINQNTEVEP